MRGRRCRRDGRRPAAPGGGRAGRRGGRRRPDASDAPRRGARGDGAAAGPGAARRGAAPVGLRVHALRDARARHRRGTGYLLKDRLAREDVLVRRRPHGGRGRVAWWTPRWWPSWPPAGTRARQLDVPSASREREVLGLMAQGRSNRRIAADLHLGAKTRRDPHRPHPAQAGHRGVDRRPPAGARRPALARSPGLTVDPRAGTPPQRPLGPVYGSPCTAKHRDGHDPPATTSPSGSSARVVGNVQPPSTRWPRGWGTPLRSLRTQQRAESQCHVFNPVLGCLLLCGGGCAGTGSFPLIDIESSRLSVLSRDQIIYGEFDPGSGRTLAACLTHARIRTGPRLRGEPSSGERVSNTWATCPQLWDNSKKIGLIPDTTADRMVWWWKDYRLRMGPRPISLLVG